jgi:hypothetical protein
MLLARSPAHLRVKMLEEELGTGDNDDDSPALTVGRIAHGFILEGRTVEQQGYALRPAGLSLATKEGKLWAANTIGNGIIPLGAAESKALAGLSQMRDAVAAAPLARPILGGGGGLPELSIVADASAADLGGANVRVRVRPDYTPSVGHIVFDLKTTKDAEPEAFSRAAFPGYHLQAALYISAMRAAGLDINRMLFVAVEKEPPFAVSVFETSVDSDEFLRARESLTYLLRRFADARDSGVWEGYTDCSTALPLKAPAWGKFAGEGSLFSIAIPAAALAAFEEGSMFLTGTAAGDREVGIIILSAIILGIVAAGVFNVIAAGVLSLFAALREKVSVKPAPKTAASQKFNTETI